MTGPDLVLNAPEQQVTVDFVTPTVYDQACAAALEVAENLRCLFSGPS